EFHESTLITQEAHGLWADQLHTKNTRLRASRLRLRLRHGERRSRREVSVRRLTRSFPLTRPFSLAVRVVRFPATPLPRSPCAEISLNKSAEICAICG